MKKKKKKEKNEKKDSKQKYDPLLPLNMDDDSNEGKGAGVDSILSLEYHTFQSHSVAIVLPAHLLVSNTLKCDRTEH